MPSHTELFSQLSENLNRLGVKPSKFTPKIMNLGNQSCEFDFSIEHEFTQFGKEPFS